MALNKQLISALYVAVYGRAPDSSGLRYWVSELNNGAAYHNIAAGFMEHPLFNHFYGGLGYGGLVRAFYENILGGAGDTSGVDYWVGRLQKGEPIAEVLASFLEASLTMDLSQQGDLSYADWLAAIDRQKILENKVEVGIHFAEHLGAGSNMQGEVNSLAVQHEARYIAARDILKDVTALRSSVEALKKYITANYQHEPDTTETNVGDWDAWFASFIALLQNGDWDNAWASLDGLEPDNDDLDWSVLDGLFNNDAAFDGVNWADFYGSLNNWDGAGLGWLGVYWEFILGWLEQFASLDWGVDNGNWWGNDLAGFYADLGIPMDQLGLLGQYDSAMLDADFWG